MQHEWIEKARSINFERLDELVSARIVALKMIVQNSDKADFGDDTLNAICRDLVMPSIYTLAKFIESVNVQEESE
jgi:hypothetical protein